jgi:hypothetical protein
MQDIDIFFEIDAEDWFERFALSEQIKCKCLISQFIEGFGLDDQWTVFWVKPLTKTIRG